MKIALTVLLILVVLLSVLFFWRGGHHAIYLANALEEYLDADAADLSLSIKIQIPGPKTRQLSLHADTFWTEYNDRPIYGVSAQNVTAWTDGNNLYMDTGRAYALPTRSGLKGTTRKLKIGMLLYGRVTKRGDTYHISMKSDELEFDIDLMMDRVIRSADIHAIMYNGTEITASLVAKETLSHPIPREISDAMVRARMEQPMALTEPLEVLLPALENLMPLEGDLTLGISCGILELQETIGFTMDGRSAKVERNGNFISIPLPGGISEADPTVLGLLLLRSGTFIRNNNAAQFEIDLSAEATRTLCTSLVPKAANLGINFTESNAVLTIANGTITSVSLNAEGEVPFLITTIPVAFQASLLVR